MFENHPHTDELNRMCLMPITEEIKADGRVCELPQLTIHTYNHFGPLNFKLLA